MRHSATITLNPCLIRGGISTVISLYALCDAPTIISYPPMDWGKPQFGPIEIDVSHLSDEDFSVFTSLVNDYQSATCQKILDFANITAEQRLQASRKNKKKGIKKNV